MGSPIYRRSSVIRKKDSSAKFSFFTLGMDSDPRLVVFFIILSTNPKMLQMMNILVTVCKILKLDSLSRILLLLLRYFLHY